MRFTPVVVAGLMALAKAQDTTAAAPAAPTAEIGNEITECIDACPSGDVNCIAHCTPVSLRLP
ncbi:hypothetical protein IMZ48_23310 [Candidatus Bathyarchaeota archaeon]|nr:hypothetical protein [Candidatus Bathyarchaeota archaeon]